ncbi:thiolase family protein [Salimicrobium halophilum]|uniref:Acetyl-CoA acetyltransferases n=1 Tax=Salimicrobium halophilum TaxID=86666 RepID=A0A1G8WNN1_9BACI|nr:thiolase family protein [Salimicrobium halophilum]SDJ79240.1 acetyl-CoA acetyltransferases [Salimicrobium halophilum]
MREVVIVEAVRTAVGKRKGKLKDVRADDLAAQTLKALVGRAKVSSEEIDDVILGAVTQTGEQAGNVARNASLMAGFPVTVPGVTIDRQCGSSQQGVHFASQAIMSGDMDVVVAGGVESMTREPMFSNYHKVKPSSMLTDKYEIVNQGISAEKIAEKWEISRQELDEFAARSHERALHARKSGIFEKEIVPVELEGGETFEVDEGPREGSSPEVLNGLDPVFKEDGVVTAGNASQMSDGASAVLLMSREKAEDLGLKPRARIVARSVVGSDPTLMLTGPIPATEKVMKASGLSLEEMDTYEVNEAFASVPLAWLKDTKADPSRLNENGGAIALGHPLGATGTKLLTTLLHRLERNQGRYGLLAICEGAGTANATIIERL